MEPISIFIAIAAVIQAGAACILVGVTKSYANTTQKILKESQIARYEDKMPILVFGHKWEERRSGTQNKQYIFNIGMGPALEVKLYAKYIVSSENQPILNKGQELLEWNRPIDSAIGTGTPFDLYTYGLPPDFLREKSYDNQVYLEIRYKDVFGRSFITKYENRQNHFSAPPTK